MPVLATGLRNTSFSGNKEMKTVYLHFISVTSTSRPLAAPSQRCSSRRLRCHTTTRSTVGASARGELPYNLGQRCAAG
jgi:hypothetical protein